MKGFNLMKSTLILIAFIASIYLIVSHFWEDKNYRTIETENFPSTQQIAKEDVQHIKKKFLFFMNPDDASCKDQDTILHEIENELGDTEIVYVKLGNQEDLKLYSKFNIKSLPTLLLMDEEDHLLHQFPSGIQDKMELIKYL